MADIKPLQGSLSLGKTVAYAQDYAPALLCALSRHEGRAALGITEDKLPFKGADLWTAYELSWLDARGKPVVAYGTFTFPCQSVGMIESKSFKLYLNSLNQTRFSSIGEVEKILANDLSLAVQDKVDVVLHSAAAFAHPEQFFGALPGECIDDLPVDINCYRVLPDLLCLDEKGGVVQEILHSHLMKTNCPVTGQPDWASVLIDYEGPRIQREGLLKYLCSFRLQQEFHEQCVERMFRDLSEHCQCQTLTIEARFQRRGGLDINPFRTNGGRQPLGRRLLRQ
jgi:7-cyano-7-deazaguanine reductase